MDLQMSSQQVTLASLVHHPVTLKGTFPSHANDMCELLFANQVLVGRILEPTNLYLSGMNNVNVSATIR